MRLISETVVSASAYSFLRPLLQVFRGNHEPFNRLAFNESIHNLRDVGDRDAPVKKVIGFY